MSNPWPNPYASKEPWEMTKEEWEAEREKIRSSSSGEHRKALYPTSSNGGKQWLAHFQWLTMGLPAHWRRFSGGESYLSTQAPKPEDDDADVAFQVPISHQIVVAHKNGTCECLQNVV